MGKKQTLKDKKKAKKAKQAQGAELDNRVTILDEQVEGHQQAVQVQKADPKQLQLLHCTNCSGVHFRHAGYVLPVIPMTINKDVKVVMDIKQVFICVKCKESFINQDDKLQNITEHIDLNAWDKTEKEAHKATGPGGQC